MRAAAHPGVYALPEDLRGRDHRRRRDGAAPAVASAQLTPSSTPLPGSTFQGADGDQLRGAASSTGKGWRPRAAWCTTRTRTPRTRRSPAARRRALPFEWTFEDTPGGVTPGKSNIRDAWSAVDQTSGRTFLYLAFARDAPGRHHVPHLRAQPRRRHVEERQGRARAVPPDRRHPRLVRDLGHQGGGVPAALEHGGHGLWSGCDRTGTVEPFTTVQDNVEVQGAMNRGRIANHLPGSFGAEIPAVQFGEVALDLDALLGQAFEGGCYAFGSIWMHSRSSTAYTVPDAGLRRARADRPPDLRRRGREVLRPRRGRRARPERARHPRVPDLRRLQREREARPGRAVDRERPYRALRAQRHPS